MIFSNKITYSKEVLEAIEVDHEQGSRQLAIMHYLIGYPTPAEDHNLRTIPDVIRAERAAEVLVGPKYRE